MSEEKDVYSFYYCNYILQLVLWTALILSIVISIITKFYALLFLSMLLMVLVFVTFDLEVKVKLRKTNLIFEYCFTKKIVPYRDITKISSEVIKTGCNRYTMEGNQKCILKIETKEKAYKLKKEFDSDLTALIGNPDDLKKEIEENPLKVFERELREEIREFNSEDDQ